ncbi:MAG: BrnT family toxin [Steroidobacteraceae bacterium]
MRRTRANTAWHSHWPRLTFLDPNRLIADDVKHRSTEQRYYCIGRVSGGVMTVRFVIRNHAIRIIGAGYWRKGKRIYEAQNRLHG